MPEKNPDNILVRGVNWIGDAVMTMPAIRALRKAYPESKISLLVKPSVAALFEKDPHIDSLIMYTEKFKGLLGKLKLAYSLRRMDFSKAILLQNAFDAAFITFLAGIPERIGYKRDGRGKLLTKPVPFHRDDRRLHHINYYLNLLTSAGIPTAYSQPYIYLSLEERLASRNTLAGASKPLIGINPGASFGSAKRWATERFADVASRFIGDTGGSVVLFGGDNELKIASEIEKLVSSRKSGQLLNLAGRTSLRELASLIAECDVVVTNDSGPMHIAYAVGTPVVAIFGSTDPDLTGPPAGNINLALKFSLSCGPCFERTCRNKDLRCMDAITADDVYQGIKNIMPERRAVFFDRDGTICREADYLNNWTAFEIFPETGSLPALKDAGFLLIGVTNQSGIYRGLVAEPFVKEVNRVFMDRYGFDDFYYCPHGPDEHCACRKPEPGMLLSARSEHRINLKKSYVVGDKDVDMLLAKAVGAKSVLVKTGKQQGSPYADFVADDLKEAVKFILSDEQNSH